MKKRRPERDERRRPLAEINLASTAKPRVALARRGCFTMFVLPIITVTTLLAASPKFH